MPDSSLLDLPSSNAAALYSACDEVQVGFVQILSEEFHACLDDLKSLLLRELTASVLHLDDSQQRTAFKVVSLKIGLIYGSHAGMLNASAAEQVQRAQQLLVLLSGPQEGGVPSQPRG